jgi:hypothetical protein
MSVARRFPEGLPHTTVIGSGLSVAAGNPTIPAKAPIESSPG